MARVPTAPLLRTGGDWRPARRGDEEWTQIRYRSEARPPFRTARNGWTTPVQRARYHLREQLKNLLVESVSEKRIADPARDGRGSGPYAQYIWGASRLPKFIQAALRFLTAPEVIGLASFFAFSLA